MIRMSPSIRTTLPCGSLDIRVDSTRMKLDDICGFASRRNRKRSFLFVSKVLGKHWPVRPSRMREVYTILASSLAELDGPVLVIGMAETATGLGQGVFDSLVRLSGRDDLLFIHTTRYHSSSRKAALFFQEVHSHATDHLLYLPETPMGERLFREARSVVIIDDEISTGNTMVNLILEYRVLNPHLKKARLISITDWLGERREQLQERCAPLEMDFVSILQGSFSFTPDSSFTIDAEVDVRGGTQCTDFRLPVNWGRFGATGIPPLDFEDIELRCGLEGHKKVLVLGSGEFSYPPFLLAEYLEQKGYDVRFQSTTRSPIALGGAITSKLEFLDNYGDSIPNFLYNVKPGEYDRIVICYETPMLPDGHDLPNTLGAIPLYFM